MHALVLLAAVVLVVVIAGAAMTYVADCQERGGVVVRPLVGLFACVDPARPGG